jgi:hypothetical protein
METTPQRGWQSTRKCPAVLSRMRTKSRGARDDDEVVNGWRCCAASIETPLRGTVTVNAVSVNGDCIVLAIPALVI